MSIQLQQAKDYTLILIDQCGNTQKWEAFICAYNPYGENYTVRLNNQRQIIYMGSDYIDSGLVFFGINHDLTVDSGIPFTQGNDCFNFVTRNPEALRTYLGKHCLNLSDVKRVKTTWPTPVTGIYLYPDAS